MKTIHLEYPHHIDKENCPETVMALGYFDGVHLGHQKVIRTAKKIADANNFESAVMTFYPHPSVVLGMKNANIHNITSITDKQQIISDLGIDRLYIVHFTHSFSELLPQQFIDHYIIDMNVKHVVAGFDFTYGRLGKGKMETMPFHSRDQFKQTEIDKVELEGEKISSTRIRQLIKNGEVDKLPQLLGRYYTSTDIVVDGDKRGRTIGFPTANIANDNQYIIPAVGVYAVRMLVRSTWYHGVGNVGYKPTFYEAGEEPKIEVHLFDFNDDIYGEEVTIEWHKRLRDEKKFSSIDELVKQISKDKVTAIKYFKEGFVKE